MNYTEIKIQTGSEHRAYEQMLGHEIHGWKLLMTPECYRKYCLDIAAIQTGSAMSRWLTHDGVVKS